MSLSRYLGTSKHKTTLLIAVLLLFSLYLQERLRRGTLSTTRTRNVSFTSLHEDFKPSTDFHSHLAYDTIKTFTFLNQSEFEKTVLFFRKNVNFKALVLTAIFTTRTDPQHNRRGSTTSNADVLRYMEQLYLSIRYHNLTAIILHDSLTPSFQQKYTTKYISFLKVKLNGTYVPNDFRFFIITELLELIPVDFALIPDIRDVIVLRDPFLPMSTVWKDFSIFLEVDIFNLRRNRKFNRAVHHCFNQTTLNLTLDDRRLYSCGLFGGRRDAVLCILRCMYYHMSNQMKDKKTCDMSLFNWCLYETDCVPKNQQYDKFDFANAWRRCKVDKTHVVGHKCEKNAVCYKMEGEEENTTVLQYPCSSLVHV